MFASSQKLPNTSATLFLDTAWFGLEHLYNEVKRLESENLQRKGWTPEMANNHGYSTFGDEPHDVIISNYFIWYASSFCNFLQVFKQHCNPSEDLEKEFAAIKTWRNKVAAHTSWVDKRKDSVATQTASIMLFPDFEGGHYEVGGWVFSSPTEGQSCAEWHWGLVVTHERLKGIVARYV
jgi:hypothetical protein